MQLYKRFANHFAAYLNCHDSGNHDTADHHEERIESLCKEHLPSGSGFDSGTEFDFEKSKPDRLIFTTAYHHMDEGGGYSGWTYHRVYVTPSLAHDFEIRVTGRDRNGIKDYIRDTFARALVGS